MAINVARFEHQGRIQWGVLQSERIVPIPGDYPTTRDFVLAKSVEGLAQLRGGDLAISEVKILSPVTRNQQFICQGANYRQHMIELGWTPTRRNST